MSTAAAPVRIHVPVAAALEMAAYEGEGIPGEYDIPIYDPDHWRQVLVSVREGDEIALVGYVPEWPEPVVQLHAVVTGFNEELPGIEVIV